MKDNTSYRIFIKPGFEDNYETLEKATQNFLSLCQDNDIFKDEVLNVVYGGDGTLIGALEKNNYKGIYLPIKSPNSLGFFTEFSCLEDFVNFKDKFTPSLENHHLLEVSANGKTFTATNEFLFSNPYATMKFSIYINDTLLCYCASSGICASTPFGSTGYNHSLGGSILLSTEGYEYNIIAPIENNIYHNSIKSIYLNEKDRMKIVMENDCEVTIAGDMKVVDFGKNIKEYNIKKTDYRFSLIHVSRNSIYKRLRASFAMDTIKI